MRHDRTLDLMLATYGEELGDPLMTPRSPAPGPGVSVDRGRTGNKRALLRRISWLAGRRGCGVNYLSASPGGAIVSAEVKSRIQLGMVPQPRPLAAVLAAERISLVGTAPRADRLTMVQHGRHIDATFQPVVHVPPFSRSSEVEHHTITEDVLLAGGDPANYRIGRLPADDACTVVCRTPAQPVWQLVGRYPDETAALQAISRLLVAVRRVERHARRLTIVEHTLLRFGRSADAAADDGQTFEYAFTATAIVALPAREASDTAIRTRVTDVLRANTPPHIVLDVLFLRSSAATEFEQLHEDWLKALRGGRGRERMEACRRMRAFLESGRQ